MIALRPTLLSLPRLLGALLLPALCLSPRGLSSARAQAAGEALNVRDCGASGSEFETTAATVAGQNRIAVADPGDFAVGQEVILNGAFISYRNQSYYGPGSPYATEEPLRGEVEMRGYTGAGGSWIVYIVEVDGANPLTFRWSDDLARSWGGTKIPITFDWQPLRGGTEVRFRKRDLVPGNMVTFSARDQLVTTITAIDGKTLTLRDAPNRATPEARLRHCDTTALQTAIDRAIAERRDLFFPSGHYRLMKGLRVRDAAIHIEGASGETTVLDISDGEGGCFELRGGKEVVLRSFRMVGHTGREQQPADFTTSSGHRFWASALRSCQAVTIEGTERVRVENVHVSKMSAEAFYSQGPGREGTETPKAYTKEITYQGCSVTDCAANAFNNNDLAENTSVLSCRIENVAKDGWQAWEGPSRYLRLIGNYVRNAGPFTIGDMTHRYPHLEELGCGQAIVSGNVFEGVGRSEGILVESGPSQVAITDNLFVNYTGNAIRVSGETEHDRNVGSFPARSVTVANNNIEMLRDLANRAYRTGVRVNMVSDVIVANNQVRVRGGYDPRVIGIALDEPALNLEVHDNLIENCGYGIWTRRAVSTVTEVIDPRTFREARLPLEWATSHRYRDWKVIWLDGDRVLGTSVLDAFDPEALTWRLKEPRALHEGDRFELVAPGEANWSIHDNTITGCLHPVVLEAYGSDTSTFSHNTIAGGGAADVKQVVDLRGHFDLVGNTFRGFDQPGTVVLALHPDRLGEAMHNLLRGNIFRHCAQVMSESQPGLWKAAVTGDNVFQDCGGVPSR